MPPLTLLRLAPERVIEFPSTKLQSSAVNLNVKNVADKPVAYKIKTTAPKNYLVRPSTGTIAPGEEQEIQIIVQPLQIFPDSNTDRFLIQAIEVESTSIQLTKEFWVSVAKNLLQDHRLSVVFKSREGESIQVPSPRPSGIAPSPGTSAATLPTAAAEHRRPAAFPPTAVTDFEAKYNDLLQYCLALDKQKAVVSNELNEARQQIETSVQRLAVALCRNCGGQMDGVSDRRPGWGLETWQCVTALVAAVIFLRFFNFL